MPPPLLAVTSSASSRRIWRVAWDTATRRRPRGRTSAWSRFEQCTSASSASRIWADAYIALPGGLGTLEELFEAATWNQLGIHAKPLGLLNVDGYFDGLLSFLRHAERQQFIRRPHVDAIVAAGEIETLLVEMQRWRSPHLDKWIP